MPTMGSESRAGGTEGSGGASLAGFVGRRAGEGFFFMRLLPGCLRRWFPRAARIGLDAWRHLFLTGTQTLQRLARLIPLEYSFHADRSDPVRLEYLSQYKSLFHQPLVHLGLPGVQRRRRVMFIARVHSTPFKPQRGGMSLRRSLAWLSWQAWGYQQAAPTEPSSRWFGHAFHDLQA